MLSSAEPAHRQAIAQAISAPMVFVAEEDGEIVGVLRGGEGSTAKPVAKGSRHRQGIGRKLVEHSSESRSGAAKVIRVAATLYAVPFSSRDRLSESAGVAPAGVSRFHGLKIQPNAQGVP